MKAFMFGPSLAVLLEDNTWACSNDALRSVLNAGAILLRRKYGPEFGDYRNWMFAEAATKYLGTQIVDDEVGPVPVEGEVPPIY